MKKSHVAIVLITAVAVLVYQIRSAKTPTRRPVDEQSRGAEPSPDEAAGSSASASEEASETPEGSALDERPLAERVPGEEQAYPMRFPQHGAFYRMLEPGDRVDIAGIFQADSVPRLDRPSERTRKSSKQAGWIGMTLLQNVTVLKVSPHPKTGAEGAVVFGSVTAQETNLLEVSAAKGRLALLPRPSDDVTIHPIRRWTLGSMVEEIEVIQQRRKERRYDQEGERRPAVEVGCRGPIARRLPSEEAVGESLRAVRVDASMPVGTVSCGDRVNIFGLFEGAAARRTAGVTGSKVPAEVVSRELLQDVTVVATTGDGSVEGLLLAVSGREAILLQLARAAGELRAAVRNPTDSETNSPAVKSFREIIHDLHVLNPHGPRPPHDREEPSIKIIRGSK